LALINHTCYALYGIGEIMSSYQTSWYDWVWEYDSERLLCNMIFFHVLSSTWQFQLLYYQIRNISSNLTTNEDMNQSRYEYLQFKTEDDEYVFANPFDAGPIQNFRQFCFSEMNWYHLYHCPEKKITWKRQN